MFFCQLYSPVSHHLAILWDTSQFHLVSGNKQNRRELVTGVLLVICIIHKLQACTIYRCAPGHLYDSQVTGVYDSQVTGVLLVICIIHKLEACTIYRRAPGHLYNSQVRGVHLRFTGVLLVICIIHKLQACTIYRRAPGHLYNSQVTGVHDLQACSWSFV